VYKPRGITPYGARKQHEHRTLLVPREVNSNSQKSRAADDEKGGDADRPETAPGDAHRC
jgi:hypothetical protein